MDEGLHCAHLTDNNSIKISFDLSVLYDKIFKNRSLFYSTCEEFILANETDFEINEMYYNEIKDIIEKYDREYGLSIDDLDKLNTVLNIFKFN